MRKRSARTNRRRGFTLIELMISLVLSTILILGMGVVLITLFTGMRESENYSDVTSRVELIRQLTFDARTGDSILFPATDGGVGDYSSGGHEGDQVQFNSLEFDGTNTTTVKVTWESQRPSSSPSGTPYTVYRFEDTTPTTTGDDVMTFAQSEIDSFDVVRNSSDSFSVSMQTSKSGETVQVELAVTLRNVIN